jgi:crotonobetainyl-CoA:carnitine CoA-transferase CaiB-like acyl-CoA transferase
MCFQALCGHDWRGGGIGNPPLWNRTSMVDFTAGLLGAVAVLQHLYQRARTGAGAELGAGLLNAGLFLLSELVQRPDGRFVGAPQLNARQTGYHPAEQLYEAQDGWLAIAARDDAMVGRLLGVLELDKAIRTPRAKWSTEEETHIAEAIRRRTVAELCSSLESAGVWAEPCIADGEPRNLRDANLVRLGTIFHSEHPQYGVVRQIGPLVRLSAAAPAKGRHAPLPGEHTDAILGELGHSAADITGLRERKIIK